jgi:signal transduction histidine kinase
MNPTKSFTGFYSLKQPLKFIIIFFLIILIGYIDYLTPPELSVRLLYLVPLFISAWDGKGILPDLFFSLFCVSVNFYTDYLEGNIYHHGFYLIWEFFIAWSFFVVFVIAIRTIRKSYSLLAKINNDLANANRTKDDLIRIASHDLKNPLGNVISISSMIRETPNISHEELDELIGWIYDSAGRMLNIIRQYLSTNLGEESKINVVIKPFPIDNMLERLIKHYRYKATHKNITLLLLCHSKNIAVKADEIHTYQILDNLLSNAVKYSPKGKIIWIITSSGSVPDIKSAQQFITVQIKDEGPGFTEDDMVKMFSKDTKLSAVPTDGEDSSGNGLYIAKKLAEEMGGRIWAENNSVRGASFYLAVPESE